MKESSWNECIEFNDAIKVSKDKFKIRSLIEIAKARMKFVGNNNVTEENVNFIFEGFYSSVLEILHAIVLAKGYKVGNHICLGYYLRDILKRNDIYRIFDDIRIKRNNLIYYGKKLDFDSAKETISKTKNLVHELELILNKEE